MVWINETVNYIRVWWWNLLDMAFPYKPMNFCKREHLKNVLNTLGEYEGRYYTLHKVEGGGFFISDDDYVSPMMQNIKNAIALFEVMESSKKKEKQLCISST